MCTAYRIHAGLDSEESEPRHSRVLRHDSLLIERPLSFSIQSRAESASPSIAKKISLHRPLHSVLFLGSNSLRFCCAVFSFFFFLRTDKYIHSSKGSISQQKNYKPGQEVPTETCLAFPSPPSKDAPINIVGAGIFALSTALHLARRGYKNVTIFDKQPYDATLYSYLDGCDAASADINKIVRSAYGSQVAYQALTFDALEQWRKHATTSSRAASTRRRACRRGTACSTTPAT